MRTRNTCANCIYTKVLLKHESSLSGEICRAGATGAMEWRYGRIDMPLFRIAESFCFSMIALQRGVNFSFCSQKYDECWRCDPCYVVPLLQDRLVPDLPDRTAQFMK